MSSQDTTPTALSADLLSHDVSREETTYRREHENLMRKHAGQYAVIHGDEVAGIFPTAEQAISEAVCRFASNHVIVREIVAIDEPAFMPLADVNDPSFQTLD